MRTIVALAALIGPTLAHAQTMSSPAKPIVTDFGWAVTPSYNGKITAKLHADTFSLLKSTRHPDEAFQALAAFAGSGDLLAAYGAFPADPSLQQAFFDIVTSAAL